MKTAAIGAVLAVIASFTSYADDELHVVGVYEGPDITGAGETQRLCLAACGDLRYEEVTNCRIDCANRRDAAPQGAVHVDVDRPGAAVTLALTSFNPVTWAVTTTEGTELRLVVLMGSGAEGASVTANGDDAIKVMRRRDLPDTTEAVGLDFHFLVEHLPGELGFERIASFHGEYRASDSGFLIDEVQTDRVELDPDYLRHVVTPVDPDDPLHVHVAMAGQVGEFLLDGTLVEETSLVPESWLAIDWANGRAFDWSSDPIRVFDIKTGQTLEVIARPEEASSHQFKAFDFDVGANRLIAMFQSGAAESKIVAYDLSAKTWTAFATTGQTQPTTLRFDPDRNRLLVAGTNLGRSEYFVGQISPEGVYEPLQTFAPEELPGFFDLYQFGGGLGPALPIVGVSGDRIALAAPGGEPIRRIYVLDLVTGEIGLTFYD